jgi:hypothetical protein
MLPFGGTEVGWSTGKHLGDLALVDMEVIHEKADIGVVGERQLICVDEPVHQVSIVA